MSEMMKLPSPHFRAHKIVGKWPKSQPAFPGVWITAVMGVFGAPIYLQPRLPSSRLSGWGTDPC